MRPLNGTVSHAHYTSLNASFFPVLASQAIIIIVMMEVHNKYIQTYRSQEKMETRSNKSITNRQVIFVDDDYGEAIIIDRDADFYGEWPGRNRPHFILSLLSSSYHDTISPFFVCLL